MHTFIKPVALGAAFAALVAATGAQALSVIGVGGDFYQINFDPITFTATADSNDLFGFIVEDFFTSNATSEGTASSGTFTALIDGVAVSESGGGNVRGPFNIAVNDLDPNDLLVGFGSMSFPSVATGDQVTFSASGLRFAYTDPLPGIADGPFQALMVDFNAVAISDTVSIDLAPIPLPAGLPLLLAGLGGLGLLARRQRSA